MRNVHGLWVSVTSSVIYTENPKQMKGTGQILDPNCCFWCEFPKDARLRCLLFFVVFIQPCLTVLW